MLIQELRKISWVEEVQIEGRINIKETANCIFYLYNNNTYGLTILIRPSVCIYNEVPIKCSAKKNCFHAIIAPMKT